MCAFSISVMSFGFVLGNGFGLKSAAETRQTKKKRKQLVELKCGNTISDIFSRKHRLVPSGAKNNLQSHVPRKVGLISENWLLMSHLCPEERPLESRSVVEVFACCQMFILAGHRWRGGGGCCYNPTCGRSEGFRPMWGCLALIQPRNVRWAAVGAGSPPGGAAVLGCGATQSQVFSFQA